ncbi:MAG: YqgE/AlgH family protein [Thermoleophilia bacterium]|nr:YqgE/AlgH family protein [Thermoleophilia bacterium]
MADGVESLQGCLLVASPALLDPNFRRAVVLVTEHTAEGAMGLVLNRPAPIAVADAVPHLACLVEEGAFVHVGGPVRRDAVVALAELDDLSQAAAVALDGIAFLPADADPDALARSVGRVRVYAGYSGWGQGQLESELAESAWIVVSAEPADVFYADADGLWAAVLRRQGGSYALLALMPLDPSLN